MRRGPGGPRKPGRGRTGSAGAPGKGVRLRRGRPGRVAHHRM